MDIVFQMAAIVILIGAMYSSYRIGFKDGTGKMIDFCKTKSDSRGYTLMHFFGNNIEFVNPLDYNKAVLDAIVDKIEDEHSS